MILVKKPKRILLKLSGELLRGGEVFGIQEEACLKIAQCLQAIRETGIELGIVLGGGNICRGLKFKQIPRTPADHMGMLATLFNGIMMQEVLKSIKIPAIVMSAIECPRIAQSYQWTKAREELENKVVVIFVGGTGNPYFTTDTAAALRASEIGADLLLKATKVDGVYDKDPFVYSDAVCYRALNYSQVLAEKLQVMDATAITLCRSTHIPIFIFNMNRLFNHSIQEILEDTTQGTWISDQ